MRSCETCTHNRPCKARIDLFRLIQQTKFLAMSEGEAKNTGVPGTTLDLIQALANCCPEWGEAA